MKRVLIVKMSAMGDIIHALPVSAALKDRYPHLEIVWAVEKPFAPLLEGNPCLSGIVALPKLKLRFPTAFGALSQHMRLVREQCGGPIDLAIDLQGLTKSALVARASGAPVRLGYHWLREAAPFLEKPVPRRPESIHIVDQYLDVARALGADSEVVRFPLTIPEADEAAVEQLLTEAGCSATGFVSINPASARPVKEWDASRFGALMDTLHESVPCVLVTADAAVAERVRATTTRPFVNLAGRTSLKQLAGVLRRSAAHVCGDTGSGHVAAALGTRVVSLMGPTDADRACPYGQRSSTITHHDLCGSGCDGKRCEFGAPRCMNAIEVADVKQAVINCLVVAGNL